MTTSRALEWFGFEARTSFENGLSATIDWYARDRAAISSASGRRP
jgi:dTDP-D-glucose 4,6-dehydratase